MRSDDITTEEKQEETDLDTDGTSSDDVEDELQNYKSLLEKEKFRRRKEKLKFLEQRKNLQKQIRAFKDESLQREAKYREERDAISLMYLKENDMCLHLREERTNRNMFVKQMMALLKERTKELQRFSENRNLPLPLIPSSLNEDENKNEEHMKEERCSFTSFHHLERSSKKKIRSMFFNENQNSSFRKKKKKKKNAQNEKTNIEKNDERLNHTYTLSDNEYEIDFNQKSKSRNEYAQITRSISKAKSSTNQKPFYGSSTSSTSILLNKQSSSSLLTLVSSAAATSSSLNASPEFVEKVYVLSPIPMQSLGGDELFQKPASCLYEEDDAADTLLSEETMKLNNVAFIKSNEKRVTPKISKEVLLFDDSKKMDHDDGDESIDKDVTHSTPKGCHQTPPLSLPSLTVNSCTTSESKKKKEVGCESKTKLRVVLPSLEHNNKKTIASRMGRKRISVISPIQIDDSSIAKRSVTLQVDKSKVHAKCGDGTSRRQMYHHKRAKSLENRQLILPHISVGEQNIVASDLIRSYTHRDESVTTNRTTANNSNEHRMNPVISEPILHALQTSRRSIKQTSFDAKDSGISQYQSNVEIPAQLYVAGKSIK